MSDPAAELIELPPPPESSDGPITADEIRAIVGRQLRAVDAIKDPGERGRTTATLAAAAMRAIEVSDLHARVAAIERITRARRIS
jgi:hypothetical protein